MARAATKGRKRPQPHARPAGAAAANRKRRLSEAEQGLFFTRIRSHAKWVFVLLAVIFAGGFVFFGVGSGSSGGGSLSDLFNNLFRGGSSGPSISKAQKEISKDPRSPKGFKDLATAYQAKGNSEGAIAALQTYVSLRPKDVVGLSQLAGLSRQRADTLRTEVSTAQYVAQSQYGGAVFGPLSTTAVGRAVGVDPFQTAVQSQSNTQTSSSTAQLQSAYQSAVAAYQKLAKLQPTDANTQLQLAETAQYAGQIPVAVTAYKSLAKLEPARAPAIDKLIKQLQPKKK